MQGAVQTVRYSSFTVTHHRVVFLLLPTSTYFESCIRTRVRIHHSHTPIIQAILTAGMHAINEKPLSAECVALRLMFIPPFENRLSDSDSLTPGPVNSGDLSQGEGCVHSTYNSAWRAHPDHPDSLSITLAFASSLFCLQHLCAV